MDADQVVYLRPSDGRRRRLRSRVKSVIKPSKARERRLYVLSRSEGLLNGSLPNHNVAQRRPMAHTQDPNLSSPTGHQHLNNTPRRHVIRPTVMPFIKPRKLVAPPQFIGPSQFQLVNSPMTPIRTLACHRKKREVSPSPVNMNIQEVSLLINLYQGPGRANNYGY